MKWINFKSVLFSICLFMFFFDWWMITDSYRFMNLESLNKIGLIIGWMCAWVVLLIIFFSTVPRWVKIVIDEYIDIRIEMKMNEKPSSSKLVQETGVKEKK